MKYFNTTAMYASKKSHGILRLIVDYCQLNLVVTLIALTVPEIVTATESIAHAVEIGMLS